MKKFLLSFLCFLMAVASGLADEVAFNFKDLYGSATLSSVTSKTVSGITISYAKNNSQNAPAFNKDGTLRLYYAANGNGGSATFTTDGSKKITKAVINATTTPTVKYSVDGSNLVAGTWSGTVMTISDIEAIETLMIQNANTSNTQLRIKSVVLTVETIPSGGGETPEPETPVAPNAPTLSAPCNFYYAMNVEITNIPDDATVYYTTDGTEPSASNSPMYTAPIEITETTTVKAIAVNEVGSSDVVTATYTKIEVPEGQVIDVLNREWTGVASTSSYSTWSGKTSNSSAVYSGNSAGDKDAIQLRSNNNNSGIVTTTSGGKVKKVIVDWNSNTLNGRTLNVYGKNTAYTSPTELYSESTKGTLLGTIVYGTSTELEVEGDYAYIGLRSNSSAMYLTSVSIVWDTNISGGGTEEVETLNTPIINPESRSFNKSINITINSNNDGASVYYTLDGTSPTNNSKLYEGVITLNESATVKAIAIKKGFDDSEIAEATYTKNVLKIEGGITDILTRETTGIEGTSYDEWSGKSLVSNAIYAGQSAGSNDAIQLRSNNSNSGIVTTTKSNSRIRSIVVDWNSNTADGRTLDIYGKNGGYESPSDLYGGSQGTSLGSIVKGTSTELLINGEPFYTSIGLRSKSGAMYINSIKITWEGEKWGTIYQDKAFEIPEDVEMYIVTSVNEESVHLERVTEILPANTGAIYKANYNVVTDCVDYNGTSYDDTNLLEGTVDATNISKEAYVLAKVDGVVGFYKAEMNKENGTAFLNNANKAYLPASYVTSNVKALKFDFNTTAVENVKVETEGKKVIYDLSGRRVNEMAQPGIYIVNGKKVMVK